MLMRIEAVLLSISFIFVQASRVDDDAFKGPEHAVANQRAAPTGVGELPFQEHAVPQRLPGLLQTVQRGHGGEGAHKNGSHIAQVPQASKKDVWQGHGYSEERESAILEHLMGAHTKAEKDVEHRTMQVASAEKVVDKAKAQAEAAEQTAEMEDKNMKGYKEAVKQCAQETKSALHNVQAAEADVHSVQEERHRQKERVSRLSVVAKAARKSTDELVAKLDEADTASATAHQKLEAAKAAVGLAKGGKDAAHAKWIEFGPKEKAAKLETQDIASKLTKTDAALEKAAEEMLAIDKTVKQAHDTHMQAEQQAQVALESLNEKQEAARGARTAASKAMEDAEQEMAIGMAKLDKV
jgi:hypothetical protein